MKVKELREKLNQIPPECDDYDIIFGNCPWGQSLKKLKIMAKKLFLSFI